MNANRQKEELQAICQDLLRDGKVDLILGFTADEAGEKAIPYFIRKIEDLAKMKWDEACTPNLAKYLLEKKGRVVIVAKPCDSRAMAMYLAEKQLERNSLYIIGMECPGMKSPDGTFSPGCAECDVRTPPVYDVLIKIEERDGARDTAGDKANIDQERETDRSPISAKLARFQKEIEKCLLCFSCRQACYGCYCETCFIDRGSPDWLPFEPGLGKKMMYHLGRAMHLAGRCIECGACERTCPSEVNIRYLSKELTGFCQELYGYRAGMDPDEASAMTVYEQKDREVGFLGGEHGD